MHLLLDSHIFLWYAEEGAIAGRSQRAIDSRIQQVVENADEVFVSAASIWELTIKNRKGKLTISRPLVDLVSLCDLRVLAVTARHGEGILDLPQVHRDPFDHLLLAQAKAEGLTLVTHDRILSEYGVPVLLV